MPSLLRARKLREPTSQSRIYPERLVIVFVLRIKASFAEMPVAVRKLHGSDVAHLLKKDFLYYPVSVSAIARR